MTHCGLLKIKRSGRYQRPQNDNIEVTWKMNTLSWSECCRCSSSPGWHRSANICLVSSIHRAKWGHAPRVASTAEVHQRTAWGGGRWWRTWSGCRSHVADSSEIFLRAGSCEGVCCYHQFTCEFIHTLTDNYHGLWSCWGNYRGDLAPQTNTRSYWTQNAGVIWPLSPCSCWWGRLQDSTQTDGEKDSETGWGGGGEPGLLNQVFPQKPPWCNTLSNGLKYHKRTVVAVLSSTI